jgi:DNA polymerase III subunit epsilon
MSWWPFAGRDRTPLEALRFAVLDTESTGLDSAKDRLLSIAAVRVGDLLVKPGDAFTTLVRSSDPGAAVAIHGITAAATQDGLEEAEALRQLEAWRGDSIWVGHHIMHDLAFLRAIAKRGGPALRVAKLLDTRDLALRLERPEHVKPDEYGLDALCKRYQIPVEERHTAAGDALATALLLVVLLKGLQERGVRTAGELFG